MHRKLVDLQFYDTYYFCNVIDSLLKEPFPWLSTLHPWHEERQAELFSQQFPRRSILHDFSEFAIARLIDEYVSDEVASAIARDLTATPWVDEALCFHELGHTGIDDWLNEQGVARHDVSIDTLADYHGDLFLSGPLDDLVDLLSRNVFFVLFGNRMFLSRFHSYVSGLVSCLRLEEIEPAFTARFTSKARVRRARPPAWAKRAIFYRERGLCASCTRDLSGLINVQSQLHYDHIVPLATGGVNDVTNLQLLCDECNSKKGSRAAPVSVKYEAWY